jgi:hypothetical protein
MDSIKQIAHLLFKTIIDIIIKSFDPVYLITGKSENENINNINYVLFE